MMALITLLVSCLIRPPVTVHGFAARLPGSVGRPVLFTATSGALGMSSSSSSKGKNTFNPFRMVGDVASSLLGGGVESNSAVDQAVASLMKGASWEDLGVTLQGQMKTDEERNFRSNLAKGYGVGSPLHKVRLFDPSNKEEDIRVTFYRDSA
jgi:hypothetical protein